MNNNKKKKGPSCFLTSNPTPPGKIAAQCGHAALAVYKALLTASAASVPSSSPFSSGTSAAARLLRRWELAGQPKIALQVNSEAHLDALAAQARESGLCARTIADAGRTQIASGSRTVLGVFGPRSLVDGVTGKLRLL